MESPLHPPHTGPAALLGKVCVSVFCVAVQQSKQAPHGSGARGEEPLLSAPHVCHRHRSPYRWSWLICVHVLFLSRARFLFSDDTSNRGQPGMTTTRSRPSLLQKLNGEEPLLYHCCRCLGNAGIRHSGKIKPAARTRLHKEVDL